MDHTTVVSALLHDVVEDTDVKLSDISENLDLMLLILLMVLQKLKILLLDQRA